jgi:hypothetical protein
MWRGDLTSAGTIPRIDSGRFLRESEKTRAKRQGIDSGSPQVANQDGPKKQAFQTKIGKKPP